jgi:hypothetical protein
VKASIRDISILSCARRAKVKTPHRRPLAIIRDVLNDREPGSAVRAVGERVAVASIVAVAHLMQAIVARTQIRAHQCGFVARLRALADPKPRFSRGLEHAAIDPLNHGNGRRSVLNNLEQPRYLSGRALRLYFDSAKRVAHDPGHAEALSQALHKRAETDTLDQAEDPDAKAEQFVAAPPTRLKLARSGDASF